MNGLVFIAALCLATGALSDPLFRSVRSIRDDHTRDGCPCKDPCDDCDTPPTCNKTYTPFCEQRIEEEVTLVCTPTSYCKTITYKGSYKWPTGCTGILTVDYCGEEGYIYDCNTWDGRKEKLTSGTYRAQLSYLNGNWIRNEYAELEDCKCEDNILRSSTTYIVTDGPDSKVAALDACCKGGAQNFVAVDYELEIYGDGCRKDCCSTCSLHSASVTYPKAVSNTRA